MTLDKEAKILLAMTMPIIAELTHPFHGDIDIDIAEAPYQIARAILLIACVGAFAWMVIRVPSRCIACDAMTRRRKRTRKRKPVWNHDVGFVTTWSLMSAYSALSVLG